MVIGVALFKGLNYQYGIEANGHLINPLYLLAIVSTIFVADIDLVIPRLTTPLLANSLITIIIISF